MKDLERRPGIMILINPILYFISFHPASAPEDSVVQACGMEGTLLLSTPGGVNYVNLDLNDENARPFCRRRLIGKAKGYQNRAKSVWHKCCSSIISKLTPKGET